MAVNALSFRLSGTKSIRSMHDTSRLELWSAAYSASAWMSIDIYVSDQCEVFTF